MHADLPKFRWIAEWLKDPVKLDHLIQRDNALHAILKSNLKAVWIGRGNGNDVFQ